MKRGDDPYVAQLPVDVRRGTEEVGMGRSAGGWGGALVAVLTCATCGEAPETAVVGATEPADFAALELEAAFPMALGNISTVRELADGSVLAADPTAPALLRMDFTAGTLDTLGRQGDGPEEYQQPDQVFALPGDSTLMVDLGKLRFTFLDSGQAFVGVMSMMVPGPGDFPIPIQPRFIDGEGRLYYVGNRVAEDALPDSVPVVRFDRGLQRHDTLAWVWAPEFVWEGRRMIPVMLNSADEWAVGADGSVAIVRANGYSVDWVSPDGSRVKGPPTPFESFVVSQWDKEAALGEFADNGINMVTSVGGSGERRMSMRRGLSSGGRAVDDLQWAETLPVFRSASAQISPRGNLWVERLSPAGEPRTLDVFDRSGVRIGEVSLPLDRQLLGFGAGGDVAYLVRKDGFDLRWVELYRIVRGGG